VLLRYLLQAQQSTIACCTPGGMDDLEAHMHSVLAEAGHGEHIFARRPRVGIEFEEAPLPAGHAFFHARPPPAAARSRGAGGGQLWPIRRSVGRARGGYHLDPRRWLGRR